MDKKSRGVLKIVNILILVVLVVSVVNALPTFFDALKRSFTGFRDTNLITGMPTTGTTGLSISVTSLAPNVSQIFPLNGSGSITESGVSNFSFSFNATDPDGADDLNDSSARINLTSSSGDQVRSNVSCGQYGLNLNTSTANYTCVVRIYYFDQAGNWTIRASIADNGAQLIANDSGANFTLFSTLAIVVGPGSLTFPSIAASAVNTTSNNDPIYVNNTGNQNITANNVRVTPITLAGQTTPAFNLSAANFSVSNQTAAFNPECNITTPELANNTVYNIAETILPRGNNSAGTGTGNGVEQVYVCLRATPGASVLPAQTYSATGGAAWTISVV